MDIPRFDSRSLTCPVGTGRNRASDKTHEIDLDGIDNSVWHVQKTGSAIAVLGLGTTGEGHVLTEEQHRIATKGLIEAGRLYGVPVIINVTAPVAERTLQRLASTIALKPDAILLAPMLGGQTQARVISELMTGKHRCPVFLYEYPDICNGSAIPDPLLSLLVQSKEIDVRGIKLSGCKEERFIKVATVCEKYGITFEDGDEIRDRSNEIWRHANFGGTVASGSGISPIFRTILSHPELREEAVALTNTYTGDRSPGQGAAGLKVILARQGIISTDEVFDGTTPLYDGGRERIAHYLADERNAARIPAFDSLTGRALFPKGWEPGREAGRDQQP